MKRGALLGAGLGQQQRPGREVEGRQRDLAGWARSPAAPAEAAGDHEVEDQKEIALQAPHDALAQASQVDDPPPHRRRDRWVDGAHQKRAGEANDLQRLTRDARPQGLDVEHYVRKLWHAKGDSTAGIVRSPQTKGMASPSVSSPSS
jgi:hypothetical protein